jgi:formylmethanofuran dehydrogenase subunit E
MDIDLVKTDDSWSVAPIEKRILVQDHTGENRVCHSCKTIAGLDAVARDNEWFCKKCAGKIDAKKASLAKQ